jgi:hypothetical protein
MKTSSPWVHFARPTTAFEQPDGVLAELVLIPVFPGMTTCSPDGDPYRIFGDPQ